MIGYHDTPRMSNAMTAYRPYRVHLPINSINKAGHWPGATVPVVDMTKVDQLEYFGDEVYVIQVSVGRGRGLVSDDSCDYEKIKH